MKNVEILIWMCVSIFVVKAQENVTSIVSAKLTVLDESVTPNSKSHDLIKVQPVQAESRSSTLLSNRTLLSRNSSSSPNKKFDNFRPSQQLETYYEYNRFPVPPALPEAKYYPGISIDDKPSRFEHRPWPEKASILQLPSTTTRTFNNGNKIKFPTTTQSSYQTINEQHPYPYLTSLNYLETTSKSPFPYLGPISTQKTPNYENQQGYSKYGGTGVGNTLSGGDLFNHKDVFYGHNPPDLSATGYGGHPVAHKTHFDQQQVVIPAEPPMIPSPWKKVIGFLTAIIPLGLLISALTPSFINVNPINNTELRGRANDRRSTKDLIQSLHYINALDSSACEERVICEILLKSGSTSADTNAERLLRIISEQDKNILINHMDEVRAVLDAVKLKNCNLLECKNGNGTRQYDIKKERKLF
ncbi:hypothetical protein PPYR_08050 [Photinus pyralis]|uniref:Uncharacterized protein n=1 Tax=Photinus pyralis TaxID=7054 RepID=A0A5N4ASF2_PHOPY|nr:uncharacterized protein LOC116166202 [Photinus pyralis]XP_031341847.1 uncharacterized protein LOC116169811 [Photinus pyralis]KAB0800170.1 hypothetical protein PPYR_08050 [Photinus pyralis]